MNKFEERERAYENQFAHDAEIAFKVSARATKLIGLWAAEKMQMSEHNATSYAIKLVEDDVRHHHENDDALASRLFEDLNKAGIVISVKAIKKELIRVKEQAKKEIISQ